MSEQGCIDRTGRNHFSSTLHCTVAQALGFDLAVTEGHSHPLTPTLPPTTHHHWPGVEFHGKESRPALAFAEGAGGVGVGSGGQETSHAGKVGDAGRGRGAGALLIGLTWFSTALFVSPQDALLGPPEIGGKVPFVEGTKWAEHGRWGGKSL